MRRIPKIVPIVIFVFATPFLMGTEKCDDGELVSGILRRIHAAIEDLDDRVTALEECDCQGLLEPVCADTGDTYVNACEARCAEVEIESGGLCPVPVCGGDTGETCDEGSFCEVPAGCDDTQVGRCMEVPEVCTREIAPVCGCDGKTYANDCLRMQEGVPLDHPGACDDVPVECMDNSECADGDFCNKRPDSCDGMGVCQPKPDACTREEAPVCGCDGMTYANVCEANANGAAVESRGACEPEKCGGDDALPCPDGFACRLTPGECSDVPSGVCVPAPEVCPDVIQPVCDCDGMTWDNACLALQNEVQIVSRGECEEPPVGCMDETECGSGEFCATATGQCDEQGECTEIPTVCADQVRPVCGCDGNDYDNPCEAAAAGASIASPGKCEDDDVCGGPDAETCEDGESCMYKTLGCDDADFGSCVDTIPEDECPDTPRPVCGCDGTTYENGCIAMANGARIASAGECGGTTP